MKKLYVYCLVICFSLLCTDVFAAKVIYDTTQSQTDENADWVTTDVFAARVIYDDTHGQTAENADWVTDGAYSEMADMLKANGFLIDDLSQQSTNKKFTAELLKDYDAIILAEPNNPYSEEEANLFIEFVRKGGGLFIIGDHDHSDRDKDGWDAVSILNMFTPTFGFRLQKDIILYEAPLSGKVNKQHPAMYGFRAVGVWAGGTFDVFDAPDAKAEGLVYSSRTKSPYIVVSEFGEGRVFAIGDSSPFDDGTGSERTQTAKGKKLHDSYDSFNYSHPQIAYNAMCWVTGKNPAKRIPSKQVAFHYDANEAEKNINILVDAAHGNAAADKMETFERHMKECGLKVYYTLNLLKPSMLKKFGTVVLPDPSHKYLETEAQAISQWCKEGGNLVMGCSWDSSKLRGTETLNHVLELSDALMRFNDDQVHDPTNKTNKPWGVLAHVINQDNPITHGVNTSIFWGSCSLIHRDRRVLEASDNVEVLVKGDDDTFNHDGYPKKPAVMYEPGYGIPMMGIENVGKGRVVLIGCCNFTDYQYPDSDINRAMPGPPPFTHETPKMYDNLMRYLAGTLPEEADADTAEE